MKKIMEMSKSPMTRPTGQLDFHKMSPLSPRKNDAAVLNNSFPKQNVKDYIIIMFDRMKTQREMIVAAVVSRRKRQRTRIWVFRTRW